MDKTELKQIIKFEKNLTLGNTSIGHQMKVILTRHPAWIRYKYVKYMRLADCSKSLLRMLYDYKRNVLGLKLGYEINARNIGGGLTLYHNGPIVINGKSIIGKNMKEYQYHNPAVEVEYLDYVKELPQLEAPEKVLDYLKIYM